MKSEHSSEHDVERDVSKPVTLCGRELPHQWERQAVAMPAVPEELVDAARYLSLMRLTVIESIEIHAGERWHHVSLSRPDRLPSWYDVRMVKNLFIGDDREAYQVLPPESEYVNTHPFVLHLWRPLDRLRVVPGFG